MKNYTNFLSFMAVRGTASYEEVKALFTARTVEYAYNKGRITFEGNDVVFLQ